MQEHLRQFFQDWVIKALVSTIKGRVRVTSIDIVITTEQELPETSNGRTVKVKHVDYAVDLMGVENWDSRVEITNRETDEQIVIHKHTDSIESL